MTDTLNISVPDGDGYQPGYAVQRDQNGLQLSAGSLRDAQVMFGIANDQNGIQMNVFPVPPGNLCRCYASWYLVDPTWGGMYSLRGDITLDRVQAAGSDTVVESITDRLEYVWWFSYSDWYGGLYLNDFTSGWHFAGSGGPGTGFLAPGYYRMKVYWWSYNVYPYYSFNAIDTKYFVVGVDDGEVSIGPFPKHRNATEHEW